MIINEWLEKASTRLKEAGIRSHRLDAELLLAHTLKCERTWLIAHGTEDVADKDLWHTANTLLTKRIHRMPIAYLVGHKEFYGRMFTVDENVLIPRPETEVLIELLGTYSPQGRAIDVGCGSGCIGITAKLEFPSLDVTLADVSTAALGVAEVNATNLKAEVTLAQSDLLADISSSFRFIFANLPYVDEEWERSPETSHEPALALFADNQGLALIEKLIAQTEDHLEKGGYLFLEADPEQHPAIQKAGALHELRLVEASDYIVVLQRA
jgi:release factor glutamine methyltransferase